MGSSPPLSTAVARALPRPGWRSSLESATAVVLGQPSLWLIGALGFLLRGGLLVLLLPVLTLPSPIDIRTTIGDGLGSAGFSQALVVAAGAAGAGAVGLVIAAMVVLAWLERASFERLVADPESAPPLGDAGPQPPVRRARRGLVPGLVAIQLLGAAGLALAAAPALLAAIDVAYAEIVRPSGGAPLYERVLGGVHQPLFVLAVAVVATELLTATATRALLARGRGLAGPAAATGGGRLAQLAGGALRTVLGALRTVLTAVLGWSVTLAFVVPALWAVSLAWQQVRVNLLLAGADDLRPAALVSILLLVAAWWAAVTLAGFASALRGAFWSMESLR